MAKFKPARKRPIGRPRVPLLARFERALPGELHEDACWEWQGRLDRHGYGRIRDGGEGSATRLAHRVSWEAHHAQPIPDGMCVCHSCDNRACVNPAHLFIGTHQDNVVDRDRKGRQIRGERHHKSKLTSKQVQAIRAEHENSGIAIARLAHDYGVSDYAIRQIVQRRHWRHI